MSIYVTLPQRKEGLSVPTSTYLQNALDDLRRLTKQDFRISSTSHTRRRGLLRRKSTKFTYQLLLAKPSESTTAQEQYSASASALFEVISHHHSEHELLYVLGETRRSYAHGVADGIAKMQPLIDAQSEQLAAVQQDFAETQHLETKLLELFTTFATEEPPLGNSFRTAKIDGLYTRISDIPEGVFDYQSFETITQFYISPANVAAGVVPMMAKFLGRYVGAHMARFDGKCVPQEILLRQDNSNIIDVRVKWMYNLAVEG